MSWRSEQEASLRADGWAPVGNDSWRKGNLTVNLFPKGGVVHLIGVGSWMACGTSYENAKQDAISIARPYADALRTLTANDVPPPPKLPYQPSPRRK